MLELINMVVPTLIILGVIVMAVGFILYKFVAEKIVSTMGLILLVIGFIILIVGIIELI